MRVRFALPLASFILIHPPPHPTPQSSCSAAGVYSALNHQLDLALARVEARAPAAAACVWPSVIVPAAAAADSTAEEQAKLEVATQVYARVLPLMGAGAGRVTDMLLASLTASELRAALDVQGELQARVQRLASLLP